MTGRARGQANRWIQAEDDLLIARWRRGVAAAVMVVKALGHRPRSARACMQRVQILRRRGVEIVGPARTEGGEAAIAAGIAKRLEISVAKRARVAALPKKLCLWCRQKFGSEGAFNRICPTCKTRDAWRGGGNVAATVTRGVNPGVGAS